MLVGVAVGDGVRDPVTVGLGVGLGVFDSVEVGVIVGSTRIVGVADGNEEISTGTTTAKDGGNGLSFDLGFKNMIPTRNITANDVSRNMIDKILNKNDFTDDLFPMAMPFQQVLINQHKKKVLAVDLSTVYG